jgi:hypothetical protein
MSNSNEFSYNWHCPDLCCVFGESNEVDQPVYVEDDSDVESPTAQPEKPRNVCPEEFIDVWGRPAEKNRHRTHRDGWDADGNRRCRTAHDEAGALTDGF